MKVLVLGGGVSVAYYLARAGHEVQLVDRQCGPALETSFGNAGEVSPGYSAPWAGPGVPIKAIKWMLMQHSPLVIWPILDPAMWRWGAMMLANCTHKAYALNKSRMVPIAEYSRDCLKALRAETAIAYDDREQGTLQLFRTQQQLDSIGDDVAVLKQYGVPFEVLDRDGFCKVEPALRLTQEKFVGALRLPGDETGDCFKFTCRLAEMATALGVKFRWNTRIEALQVGGGAITGVHTDAGLLRADRVVLALGSHSPQLLAPVGVRIPVYPVKGYSITVPITDAQYAPESTIMDETHKVAVTRLGDRIRVGIQKRNVRVLDPPEDIDHRTWCFSHQFGKFRIIQSAQNAITFPIRQPVRDTAAQVTFLKNEIPFSMRTRERRDAPTESAAISPGHFNQ